jgi:predicted SAM-dependent methyltransferase
MKKFSWLSEVIRRPLVLLRNNCQYQKRKRILASLSFLPLKKIVVGAGGTNSEGWVSTEQDVLNILFESDWASFFKKNSLDVILAEHVWEHLSPEEGAKACRNCFAFLKKGGMLRIAVPDGFHPDLDYIAQVKPEGYGPGADDHKVLYTYKTLSAELKNTGYQIKLLEWFDEQGNFHYEEWDIRDGMIKRSTRFDPRNKTNPTAYTSLIIDAIKP